MNVSAIIVTRGDVDLSQIIDSLEDALVDEVLIWNNGDRQLQWLTPRYEPVADLAVYGRYAAIEYAKNDFIYVQDDDCLHHPEGIEEIIRSHMPEGKQVIHDGPESYVTCNMPANFRHAFYQEHSLVGFGACFHRNAPARAFSRFMDAQGRTRRATSVNISAWEMDDHFLRTCDIVFTALTPRVLVDVDYQDMPWASADNRMWKQPTHREERGHMLDLCKEVLHAHA